MMKMATTINVKATTNFITRKQNTRILSFRKSFSKTVHRTEDTTAAIALSPSHIHPKKNSVGVVLLSITTISNDSDPGVVERHVKAYSQFSMVADLLLRMNFKVSVVEWGIS
jgi:hypothetical protein